MEKLLTTIVGLILIVVLFVVPDVIGTYDEDGNNVEGAE